MPLTKLTPKPLVNIFNKPLIQHIIHNFYNSGFRNFYFGLNYKKNDMIKFIKSLKIDIKKNIVIEKKPLGTIGILSLIKNLKCENFFFFKL